MTTLVLKGHSTRCVEVIQLLVMLSAKSQYTGTFKGFYYWIEDGQVISSDIPPENSMIFSLEEFLEKYPYKVGDKVKAWINGYYGVFNIQDITWDSIAKEVKYRIHDYWWYSVENLQPYKEVIMEKNQPPKTQAEVDKYLQEHSVKNVMNVVDIETCLEMDGLKLPENVVINSKGIGSIQFIQWYEKPQYPKTYDECCNILGIEDRENGYCGYEYELLGEFQKLYICRNAYWKIAGEEMGLDKPWEPNWNNVSDKHCIYFVSGEIWLTECQTRQCTLAFPTKEMRDVFYNNFKDLIEKCKELL